MKLCRLNGKAFMQTRAAVAAGIVLLASTASAVVEGADSLEDKVKAAILVKLTKFVEWPQTALSSGSPIIICLLGDTRVAEALQAMPEHISSGHAVKIRAIRSAADLRPGVCQILFMGRLDDGHTEKVLSAIKTWPVLTVSDVPNYANRGGMIELVRDENHLAFKVNLAVAKQSGLLLSSQLLALATIIE